MSQDESPNYASDPSEGLADASARSIGGDNEEEETNHEKHEEEEEIPQMTEAEARQKVLDMLRDGSIAFPEDFTNDDLQSLIEGVEFPQEISPETVEQYHSDCVALIREELVPEVEKPDEDEEGPLKLTPQFIAERLSDLQEVDGEHLTFAFSSFAVQEAEIYDISALAEYQTLTFIRLKGNIIADASPLNGLTRLRELYLSENKITSFSGISLPELTVLDLASNQFRALGHLSLPKLKKLNLGQNKICYIAQNAFSETPELTELILTENKIKLFKPDTFKSCDKLEKLMLDQNQIVHIKEGMFDGLTGLKTLNMNDNQTESIDGISSLTALETLELQQSSLVEVENLKPMIDLKALKSINFTDSPVDGNDNFKLDIILLLPWVETLDEEAITFTDRQEAIQLDEERKAEEERARLEAEREAAERAAQEAAERAAAEEEEEKGDSESTSTLESN